MRKLIYFLVLGALIYSCSPKAYNFLGKDFSLFEKQNEGFNPLLMSHEGCYDFKMDSTSTSIDGVQIPWVRMSERSSESADGSEFSKFYSYISFIDEKRVVIYAPFKVSEDNVENDSIYLKDNSKNFDYLRGYYFIDNKNSKVEIEVENKKRKELMFFTFKMVFDTTKIEEGYLEIEGGTFSRKDNKLSKENDGNILLKSGKLNGQRRKFTIKPNQSHIDPLGKLKIVINEDWGDTIPQKIHLEGKDVLLANGFKVDWFGRPFELKGSLTIKKGILSIDENLSARDGRTLEVTSGILDIESGVLWRNRVVGLELESLKVKNELPIKGSYADGFDYRYIHAEKVFEFVPYYQGVNKAISLYLDLPIGDKIKVDSIKHGIETIDYYYKDSIWTERKNDLKTW